MGPEGKKAHLLGAAGRSPLEVESCLRRGGTKALVDGFSKVDMGLNPGHAALRETISAEVRRLAATKEAAKAAAELAVAQGDAPSGQAAQGSSGAHVALAGPSPRRARVASLAGLGLTGLPPAQRSQGVRGPGRRCTPSQEGWSRT